MLHWEPAPSPLPRPARPCTRGRAGGACASSAAWPARARQGPPPSPCRTPWRTRGTSSATRSDASTRLPRRPCRRPQRHLPSRPDPASLRHPPQAKARFMPWRIVRRATPNREQSHHGDHDGDGRRPRLPIRVGSSVPPFCCTRQSLACASKRASAMAPRRRRGRPTTGATRGRPLAEAGRRLPMAPAHVPTVRGDPARPCVGSPLLRAIARVNVFDAYAAASASATSSPTAEVPPRT